MESKKINQLATNLAPVNTDLTVIGDPLTGELKKITLLQIASLFGAGLTSVGMVVPSGFTVSPASLTSSGTFTIAGAGTTAQYIDGTGALQTFPTLLSSDKLIHSVRNNSGATISKGTIVYINGALGNKPTIAKALATSDATSAQTYGVVQADIANNADGNIVVIGDVENLDTSAVTEGTQLYLSGTTAGAYTSTKPYAPTHLVYVAVVLRSHPTLGIIGVKIQNGYEMDELHNVSAQSPANNDGLFYNTSTSLWEKKSIATVLGYTPVTSARLINTTSPLSGGGDLSADRTLTIAQANTTTSGYLSSTDWNTFNNKQSAITLTVTGSSGSSTFSAGTLNVPTYTLTGLGGQPLATNLTNLSGLTFVSTSFVKMTASGTFGLDTNTYYLASNPSGYTSNVGTVTSVAALTLGTTGTDLSSSVATGTSTPVITLNVPTASGTNRGALSSADWTTFNGKQAGSTNLTSLSGLTYVSTSFVKMTASGTFSLDTATYLTANQTITLSGDVSGSGTTAITTAIGTNKVTNAMLAQIATASFLGRVTAATGNVETLTATQATSLLNVFSSTLKGLTPSSGGGTTNFLRADGTWAAPSGTGFTNPMTTLGDLIYGDTGGAATKLAGNITTAKQFLSQTGTGTASAIPSWATITGSDITGAALTKVDDTNVTLTLGGTPTTALLRAASITVGWTGTLADARIASAATWNAKQSAITLTTTGNSGASTFVTNTLNIPTYTLAGLGGQASSTNLTSLSGLTYVSTSFVKMTAAGTFALDTSTYLTANQSITLSGDVSGTGSTAITTSIGANKVTNAMLAQVATASFLGRVTAATGNVETLTGTQATTLLDVFSSTLKGLTPASGGGTTNFLRADGTWAAPSGSSTNIYNTDGTLTGARTVTLGANLLTFSGSRTSGNALSISSTQTSINTTDTGDGTLFVGYTLTSTTASTIQLVSRAFSFTATNNVTGAGSSITNLRVLDVQGKTNATTTTTNLDMIYILGGSTASGTVTSSRGVYVRNLQGTSQGGIVIEDLTAATNSVGLVINSSAGGMPTGDYGIYQYGSSLLSYFEGFVTANKFTKIGAAATDILAGDGSVITAGTNITISGGQINASSGVNFYTTDGTLTSARTITGGGFGLTYSNNQNSPNTFTISNTIAGTGSRAETRIDSDTGAFALFGKASSTYTTSNIISAGDTYIYNSAGIGNIVIQNLNTTGGIEFLTGGTGTTPTMTYTSDGHLLINTTTNGTYFLDVNGDINVGGKVNIAAGTASRAPIDLTTTSAVLKTSPIGGDLEVDANGISYYTHNTSERGVIPAEQFITLTSAYTLAVQTASQKLFNVPTNGQITVKANTTYFFECLFYITNMSATSGNFGFELKLGTATIASQLWMSLAQKTTTVGTAGNAQQTLNIAANTAMAVAGTQVNGFAHIRGKFVTGTGGTIIPAVSFTINPQATCAVQPNSYFKLTAAGINTIQSVGAWS